MNSNENNTRPVVVIRADSTDPVIIRIVRAELADPAAIRYQLRVDDQLEAPEYESIDEAMTAGKSIGRARFPGGSVYVLSDPSGVL